MLRPQGSERREKTSTAVDSGGVGGQHRIQDASWSIMPQVNKHRLWFFIRLVLTNWLMVVRLQGGKVADGGKVFMAGNRLEKHLQKDLVAAVVLSQKSFI